MHTPGASAVPAESYWKRREQTNITGIEDNSRGPLEGSVLATVTEYLTGAISAPRQLLRDSDRQLAIHIDTNALQSPAKCILNNPILSGLYF